MRLIDSDKIEYMWKLDRNGKFRDGVTLESIVDDMPTVNVNDLIIKELEKIKEEIENMWIKSAIDLRTGEVIYKNLCEHSEVLEIIDNHIFELKGE